MNELVKKMMFLTTKKIVEIDRHTEGMEAEQRKMSILSIYRIGIMSMDINLDLKIKMLFNVLIHPLQVCE